jgi:hypothetical protein
VTRRSAFIFLLALLSARAAAAQQEIVVQGYILGPDSTPLALERVLLHRVDQAGGATIAEGPSGPDGRFKLAAPITNDTSGIYFIAARYEGELYIGSMFRLQPDLPDQVLQVGVPATSASALVEAAGRPPPAPAPAPPRRSRWLLLIVPLLAVAAAVLYMIVPRSRVSPERARLIRIAEIDERSALAPPGQREAMRAERDQLIEQLRSR